MPRYKLVVEYDGTPYVGWQAQANGRGVQNVIEEAVLRFSGEQARLQCSGRTDTGVHATGQVAHVDLAKAWRPDVVRDAVNAHMKDEPVSVLSAEIVPEGFSARTSAIQRHYLYRILNRRPPPAVDRLRVWHVIAPLDSDAMRDAAQRLLGHHDFTTFRSSDCQANGPMRTLERLDVERDGDEIRVYASARSFLHRQVRSMVGTIAQVGTGRWTGDDVANALAAQSRTACGPVAPAHGLTFIGVDFRPMPQSVS